jgi:cytochrome c biogenesis protein CcmG, thiol:disulfide interchange protein DsbE
MPKRMIIARAYRCTLAILIIAGCLSFLPAPEARSATTIQAYSKPQASPDFALEDLAGKTIDIRGLRGRVVVLNFWTTW